MTVPEAAVDEAHGTESTEHEIGSTRKRSVVQAISQAPCVEGPSEDDFGYSVPTSDCRHHS